MITNISIRNFKIHNHTEIGLKNLTILTGLNGMGKSSIIQLLLLLRQSDIGVNRLDSINLKGELCDIGAAGGLACQSSLSENLEITLNYSDIQKEFIFEYPDDIYDTELKRINDKEENETRDCPLFGKDFQYIGAFRFGPQKSYNRDSNIVKTKRQISKVMGQCEYCVHFLEDNKNENIPIIELAASNTENEDYRLSTQVELWMSQISPNIKISVEQIDESFRLNYKFTREGERQTESITALNTGFGITYVLPILIAILSAKKGAIILIENPEAHIHPKGQSIVMQLVAIAAANGVQIILETHSDHIINGALVQLVQKQLTVDMLSIYFFERDERFHSSLAHQLLIKSNGRIKNPPYGFFDQLRIDMSAIMGF